VSDTIDGVAKVIEQRKDWSDADAATVPAVVPKVHVKDLFVGPFVLDTVLRRKAYDIDLEMHTAAPPSETDDMDCKGFWLKPDARTYDLRVKKLKSQVSCALVTFMTELERMRPRIIAGEGQGGVVAAMSTFPVILERACRDRAVTLRQMETFRKAW